MFTEIAQQYFIQFLPEKTYKQVDLTLNCNGYQFKTSEIKIINHGWEKLVDDDDLDEDCPTRFDLLSALTESDTGACNEIFIKKEKTKPLPLYTEATLLKDLANIAKYVKDPDIKKLLIDKDKGKDGENGGIGTPATRSAIISRLGLLAGI